MSKKLIYLLSLGAFVLASCSDRADEPIEPPANETRTVTVAMSRAAKDDFVAAGVDKYTIYIYHNDRNDKSLFSEQTVSVDQTNATLEFSLGDNFCIFAVANVSNVTGKENFETLELHIDPSADTQVWMTDVIKFTSDKSVDHLDMTMQRKVARVEFAPAETVDRITGAGHFDAMKLTFTNTASTYKVSTGIATASEYTATVNAADGFATGFYTFDTNALGAYSMLDIAYMKGDREVNHSAGQLETGVMFTANNRYKVTVPVLDNGYVRTPWTSAGRSTAAGFTVDVTPF